MDNKNNPSMRELRKEKALEADRLDILKTATRLFASQGIDQTSMADIAAESGFSVGKLYKFFPGKNELFSQIAADFMETLFQSAEKAHQLNLAPLPRLRKVLEAAIKVAIDQPEGIIIYLHENPSLTVDLKKHYHGLFIQLNERLLSEAMEAGHLQKSDSKLLAIMMVGVVDALFSHYLTTGKERIFSPIPDLVFDHFITPIMTESALSDEEPKQ